ncbi:hypothetical protein CN692_16190 [Bacillus sp. AFS002410]|uniref:hypothetical protein n=1 Tax=Bacillus sp. AFS002410 TaxID=2033481 RepID=UPI000BF0C80F|nr:hypothetical protein [Bacillus sp. AFS002410]PEJ56700.1 hypothetical protein CN692_16190 [Bacillus sp. AFS002410]
MNLIKYFVTQLMFCGVVFLTGYYLDSYISKPYTIIDLIALIIGLVIYYIIFTFYEKAKKGLKPVRFEILFTVITILIAAIIIGVLTGEVKF